MFDLAVADEVCRCRRIGARWLLTGWNGGFSDADAVYNVTVPDDFDRTDLAAFSEERRTAAGFEAEGPALLTGVSMAHARCASDGPVTVVATVGVSNPASLPMNSPVRQYEDGDDGSLPEEMSWHPGTVNLVVGVQRSLADGTLAELLATCVEAKAATLLDLTGVPGTTSDAVAVGCVPSADPAAFAGSATIVGGAARACVRDAVRASFASRYGDGDQPPTVEDAAYGVVTDRWTSLSRPSHRH